MLRFKQFAGSGSDLEQVVNSWLEEFEPDITQMTQSERADGSVLISFVFEESFRGQELRLSSERGMGRAAELAMPPEASSPEPIEVEESTRSLQR